MRKIFVSFFFLTCTLNAISQQLEWMLYDTFWGGEFKEGVTSFFYEKKYGLMNSSGEVLIAPMFEYSFEFVDNVAIVRDPKTSLYGVINRDGKYIIKPEYTSIYEPECGFIRVYTEAQPRMQALFNTKGKLILPLAKYLHVFVNKSDSTVSVTIDGDKQGLVNKYGDLVFDTNYESVYRYFGRVAAGYDRNEKKYLVKQMYGGESFVCDKVGQYTLNVIRTYEKGVPDSIRYYDHNLQPVSLSVINELQRSKSGLFAFYDKTLKKYGFKNAKGVVVAPVYSRVNEVCDKTNNLFHVQSELGKWGCIDGSTGKVIIAPNYTSGYGSQLNFDKNGFSEIKIGDNYGLIMTDGTVVLKPTYETVREVKDGLYYVKTSDGKSGVLVPSKGCQSPVLYDVCWTHEINDGLIVVGNKQGDATQYGYVNLKGELQIPMSYSGYGRFSEGLAVIALKEQNYKRIVIDTNGKIILQSNDDVVIEGEYFSEGAILANDKKGGNKQGYIKNPLLKLEDVKPLYEQTLTLSSYKNNPSQQKIEYTQDSPKTESSNELYQKALSRFESSDYVTSAQMLNTLISQNNKNADYYNLLGACYHNVGDYSTAISYYNAALSIDSHHSVAKSNLKKAKRSRGWQITGAIFSVVLEGVNAGLNTYNQMNQNYQSPSQNTNTRSSGTTKSGLQLKETVCSSCKGTGNIDSNDTPTFGNTDQKFCKECDRMREPSHCHGCKICPACGGTGKRKSYSN